MIIKTKDGKIDIGKSMDNIQAELKEVWGENPVSIRVSCSDQVVQEEQNHDCIHCKYWEVDPELLKDEDYEPLPAISCQKRYYADGVDNIDPHTAGCKYWKYKELKNA